MKTIDIRGKSYITVNERLKEFRNNFKDYSLTSEIVELGTDFCTMKATITDDKGVIRATGYAREVVAKSPINKFAFVENCETSAIGRALGNFGIGIDTAICTADELLLKLAQEQESEQKSERAEKANATRAVNKEIKLTDLDKRYNDWLNYWMNHEWSQPANESFRRFLDEAKDYDPEKMKDLIKVFKDKAPEDNDSMPDWA